MLIELDILKINIAGGHHKLFAQIYKLKFFLENWLSNMVLESCLAESN